MTHEFALYIIETLLYQHGDVMLEKALETNYNLLPSHKQLLLEAFNGENLLSLIKQMLTPPEKRDEIENLPCRSCGSTNCETVLMFTGFQKTEAWFCKDCSYRVVLPPVPDTE